MKLHQIRPQIAICLKCKHRIKTYPFLFTKISCCVPGEPTKMNYITGKVTKTTYPCKGRNQYGSCKHYEKLWYRRPTYVKPLFVICLLMLGIGCTLDVTPKGVDDVWFHETEVRVVE